jgi:hypothetical protein
MAQTGTSKTGWRGSEDEAALRQPLQPPDVGPLGSGRAVSMTESPLSTGDHAGLIRHRPLSPGEGRRVDLFTDRSREVRHLCRKSSR